MNRYLVVCPGRGSYARASLGSLVGRSDRVEAFLDLCDAWRTQHGRPTVRELDASERYRGTLHVAGEHSSILTFACSVADYLELGGETVGVAGNSMGFYTALAVSGVLSFEDAIRLVDTMGSYQAGNVIGGQVLYPITGSDWYPSEEHLEAVESAIAGAREAGAQAWWSIRLGGHAVLGGDDAGVRHLLANLPAIDTGARRFPLQLPLHSAFHTPLLEATAARAQDELADLDFRMPKVPLIDGRGEIHTPFSADPERIRAWTLGEQITRTYDFQRSIVTALHYCGPDVVTALGPGNALGGPLARILLQDHWRGAETRAAFDTEQQERPMLLSFGVTTQRRRLDS